MHLGFFHGFLVSLFFLSQFRVDHGASRDFESTYSSFDIPMLFRSFACRFHQVEFSDSLYGWFFSTTFRDSSRQDGVLSNQKKFNYLL